MDDLSTFWNFIADFGDLAVLLPGLSAICLILCLRGKLREALVWCASFAGCFTLTLLLKITVGRVSFDLLGDRFVAASFPSGHTAMSAMFYLGLAALMRTSRSSGLQMMAASLFVTLTGLIATSMVVLDWHSGMDVAGGLLLGVGFAAFPAWMGRLRTRPPREVFALGLAAIAAIAVFHGIRLDTSMDIFRGIVL